MPFEPQFPSEYAHLFHGSFNVRITDPDGTDSRYILSLEDQWKVSITLRLGGIFGRFINLRWRVRGYVESVGDSPEGIIIDDTFQINGGGETVKEYVLSPNAPFKNSTGSIQEGIYKLVVAVTALDSNNQPAPFGGYDGVPFLQFYAGPSL
ncbi:MAG: hypothetical protein KC496_05180 [Anaerolineae bacterium]|nr:hypothetical protein [Anaerolineae bacterium]